MKPSNGFHTELLGGYNCPTCRLRAMRAMRAGGVVDSTKYGNPRWLWLYSNCGHLECDVAPNTPTNVHSIYTYTS